MNEYNDINRSLSRAAQEDRLEEACSQLNASETRLADVLLHPQDKPPVIQQKACSGCADSHSACEASCLFDAIRRDKDGNIVITGNCVGCGECVRACPESALAGRKDSLAVLQLLKQRDVPVYAMIAPAFTGQFSGDATPAKLRTAFKQMGFYGMVEVALFADILTLKEALEFDRAIQDEQDYVLTSCCCPMWIAMIRKSYKDMIPHVPPSVSPMVACGRSIKRLHPEAKTVFIGPCLAKKAEARDADIADAVDYVLTFEETAELFSLMGIDPSACAEEEIEHASRAGRIYARATGVSEAVQTTLDRLRPNRAIPLKSMCADGVVDCKKLLAQISDGHIKANFIEGMGCVGGCVGGPKALIDRTVGREAVERYGNEAASKTPVDNPFVLEVLHRLGYETVESLLDRDKDFVRTF